MSGCVFRKHRKPSRFTSWKRVFTWFRIFRSLYAHDEVAYGFRTIETRFEEAMSGFPLSLFYVCICIYIYIYTYIYINTHTHIHMCIYTSNMYVSLYMSVHTHNFSKHFNTMTILTARIGVCVYIYLYTHTLLIIVYVTAGDDDT